MSRRWPLTYFFNRIQRRDRAASVIQFRNLNLSNTVRLALLSRVDALGCLYVPSLGSDSDTALGINNTFIQVKSVYRYLLSLCVLLLQRCWLPAAFPLAWLHGLLRKPPLTQDRVLRAFVSCYRVVSRVRYGLL